MKRRTFLRTTVAAGLLAGAGVGSLFTSAASPAAARPPDAFAARTEAEVVRALFGDLRATPSKAVRIIDAPYLAMREVGVPLNVACDLDGVETIAVVIRNNRQPLNTVIRFSGIEGYYHTRIKVERTSPVTVYVKADGRLYSASTFIKVTGGGYGMYAPEVRTERRW
jgi:predicted secreted protein